MICIRSILFLPLLATAVHYSTTVMPTSTIPSHDRTLTSAGLNNSISAATSTPPVVHVSTTTTLGMYTYCSGMSYMYACSYVASYVLLL